MGRDLPHRHGFPPVMKVQPFLLAVLLFFPNIVIAQSAMEQTGSLRTGLWSLSVLTREFSGAFCLFEEEPGGSVRIEAFMGSIQQLDNEMSPQALDNLLWRQHGGWTVILAENGTGIVNPWDESWEEIDPELIVYLQSMLAALDLPKTNSMHKWPSELKPLANLSTKIPRPSFAKSLSGKFESIRFEMPQKGTDLSFRQKMVLGGRGSGLNAEILQFNVETVGGQDVFARDSVVLRSSRRPGAFRMTEQNILCVNYADHDPFLVMWPLGDLLRFK